MRKLRISSSDIYQSVRSREEFLPEMTGEIFSRMPLTDFLKICTLSMRHAEACKKPQYWISYLSNKPKEDWIRVIKHFAPSEEPDDVDNHSNEYILLQALIDSYSAKFHEKGLRFMFSVVDSYDMSDTYLMLAEAENLDYYEDYSYSPLQEQLLKVRNIITATRFDDHYLELQLVNDSLKEFWWLVSFAKYLKEKHVDQSKKLSKTTKRKILDRQDEANEFIAYFSNGKLLATPMAYGIYTKTLQQLLNIHKNLDIKMTPLEIATNLLANDRSYAVNLDLLRDIVRSVPDVLDKLDKLNKKDSEYVREALELS